MSTQKLILMLYVVLSAPLMGCKVWWPFQSQNTAIDAPIVFQARPSQQQLIESINANSSKIYQLQSQVRLTVEGLPGLSGDIALERPNRFRLNASLLGVGGNGVDVGSNDEVFWIWVKSPLPGQPPEILYARHDEFANSPMKEQIPIDPAWIRDAIGLTEISPQAAHEGPFVRTNGDLELRTSLETASGRMTRLTIVDPKYGWVKEQSLLNSRLQTILVARSSSFRYYQEADVSLPQRIEIDFLPGTADAQKLTLDASGYQINQLNGSPDQLWSMPKSPGVRVRNLIAEFQGMQNAPRNNYSQRYAQGPSGQNSTNGYAQAGYQQIRPSSPNGQPNQGSINYGQPLNSRNPYSGTPDPALMSFNPSQDGSPPAGNYGNYQTDPNGSNGFASNNQAANGTTGSPYGATDGYGGTAPFSGPGNNGQSNPSYPGSNNYQPESPGSYRTAAPYQQNYRGQTIR